LHTEAWYLPGVGVVRQQTFDSSGTLAEEAVLTGFESGAHHWGYMTRDAQVRVVDGKTTATPVGPAGDAVMLADGALVATADGVHRLDLDGRIVASYAAAPVASTLIRVAAGVRTVAFDLPGLPRGGIAEHAPSGEPTGVVVPFNFTSSDFRVNEGSVQVGAGPGADRFWLVWSRLHSEGLTVTSEIVVQAVRVDGTSAAPEVVLPIPDDTYMTSETFQLAVGDDGVVVAWQQLPPRPVTELRVAKVTNAGQLAYSHSLDVVPNGPYGLHGVRPLADGTGAWLVWSNPGSLQDHPTPYGARMDAGGVAGIDDGSALAPLDVLAGQPVGWAWANGFTVSSGHFIGTMEIIDDKIFEDDVAPTGGMQLADLDAGQGALATSVSVSGLMTLPGVRIGEMKMNPPVFDDRILVLSNNGRALTPTVIWR
jgi:hypothetical protein